ncbi:hypothetical protein BDA99DRAFT_543422 [Phascolomyces articulosus]|uniref:Galactose oxidase n=1 Tax=Phascolomyces articulosus TaxID=60185 RepID=A0AAD5JYU6_9FUNG|nr:hypothetical protein BDA99DRAFT_543422 [Phascolomyces articulosus]
MQRGGEVTQFDRLVDPLVNPIRKYAATFMSPDGDTAYVWGGEGKHSTRSFRDIVPYFNAIKINGTSNTHFQNVTYDFVNNSRDYKNFATAASAILDPHNNNRVFFFGGYRATLSQTNEDGPLYVEQYDFSNSQWTSITPTVTSSPSTNGTGGGGSSILPPRNRAYASVLSAQGNIYIAGGVGTDANQTVDPVAVWMYDSINQVFSPMTQRSNVTIGGGPYESIDGFVLRDGRILYITGINPFIFIFDPSTNSLTRQDAGFSDPDLPQDSFITQGLVVLRFHYTTPNAGRRNYGYTQPGDIYELVFTNSTDAMGGGQTNTTTIAPAPATEWSWISVNNNAEVLQDYQGSRYGASVAVNTSTNAVWRMFGCGEVRCFNTFDAYSFGDFVSNGGPTDGESAATTIIIVPVVVSIVVLVLITSFVVCIYRRNRNVKKALDDRFRKFMLPIKSFFLPLYSYILFNPRVGEPTWAERSHMVTKILFACIFIAYLTYNINQVVNSPTSTLSIQNAAVTVPTPDIRLCLRGMTNVNMSCTVADSTFCPKEEPIPFTNARNYPYSTYQPARLSTDCWFSQGGGELGYGDSLEFGLEYILDNASAEHTLQVDVYPMQSANPNIYLYYTPEQQNQYFLSDVTDPRPDQQTMISWALQDVQQDGPNLDRYIIDLSTQNRPMIVYQHQKHKYLSSSGWNVMGFASIYDEVLEITTNFQVGSSAPRLNEADGGTSSSVIVFRPMQIADITLQEQRMFPLVTVLGSVGGLLALLITINGFLYGTRPSSPWGAVHNFFGFKRSLQQNIYDKFGFLGRPIPLIHPVDPRLFNRQNEELLCEYHHLLEISSFEKDNYRKNKHTLSLEQAATNNSSNTAIHQLNDDNDEEVNHYHDETSKSNIPPSSTTTVDNYVNNSVTLGNCKQSHEELKRRIQYLELLLKAYYIDDEVIVGINNAYENPKIKKSMKEDTIIDIDNSRPHNPPTRSRFTSALQRPFQRHRYHQQENIDSFLDDEKPTHTTTT